MRASSRAATARSSAAGGAAAIAAASVAATARAAARIGTAAARRRSTVAAAGVASAIVAVTAATRRPARRIRTSTAWGHHGLLHVQRGPPGATVAIVAAGVFRILPRRSGRLRIVRTWLRAALRTESAASAIRLHLFIRSRVTRWRTEWPPSGTRRFNRLRRRLSARWRRL